MLRSFQRMLMMCVCTILASERFTSGADVNDPFVPSGLSLRDPPIIGDSSISLDGDDWVAVSRTSHCEFLSNTDFDAGTRAATPVPALSANVCCGLCAATSSTFCAGSVWFEGKCWFKTAQQMTKPSASQGRTGCIRTPSEPHSFGFHHGVPSVAASKRSELSDAITIAATVPGDIISDLYRAGVIANPYFELNWLNSSIWAARTWQYEKTFTLSQLPSLGDELLLVLDGIKMGATVQLNGKALGVATDQFVRYTFPLVAENALVAGTNHLAISFNQSIGCDGRWMGCSGGWDWAPYSNTQQEGAHTMSFGIWKSVSLVSVSHAAVTDVAVYTFYTGDYPTTPLIDHHHDDFDVQVRVHVWAPAASVGELTVAGAWSASSSKSQTIQLKAGSNNITLNLVASASDIQLWWPAGSGKLGPFGASPMLYNVSVSLSQTVEHKTVSPAPLVTQRRIGFRTVALVTGNDTDPEFVKKAATSEGSMSHGMYFRVNGAVQSMRGASMIPMEEMEGWMDADAHVASVRSAAEGRFNMLRVWGGGIWLPSVWYDTCDELGIMIYHDMQFAQNGHAPKITQTQDTEIRHQVRRLAHHPSIVIWDGCNECQVIMGSDTEIYATFVLAVVAEEDTSRPVWPSCPSVGWSGGVRTLDSRPIAGKNLTTPNHGTLIETHRPKWHGDGFASVNGLTPINPAPGDHPPCALPPCNWQGIFPSNIPLNLTQQPTGPSEPNVFSSESPGASVMSSFESMSATLTENHWSVHGGTPWDNCTGSNFNRECVGGNSMAQRNYPCDNFIAVYWGLPAATTLNQTGEHAFKRQLFQCMIAQALIIKQNIELTRATPRFGILVWQFNEVWPTGGWGSVEYGNPKFKGQVIGGRWKPLQYWFRASLFADVLATCDAVKGLCYVKNDAPVAFAGYVVLNATHFGTGVVTTIARHHVDLDAGAGTIQWFQSPPVAALTASMYALEAIVVSSVDGSVASNNVVALATPQHMQLKPANVSVVAQRVSTSMFVANVRCDAVAMYVTLTTLAHGRFSDNALLVRPPGVAIAFELAVPSPHASAEDAWSAFSSSVRVEDVSTYAV
eukprot:m.215991 g.215991  ORF g.215991 m.215991 type:complete len:1074 (-) comp33200_c0_seq2:397-3618(-)